MRKDSNANIVLRNQNGKRTLKYSSTPLLKLDRSKIGNTIPSRFRVDTGWTEAIRNMPEVTQETSRFSLLGISKCALISNLPYPRSKIHLVSGSLVVPTKSGGDSLYVVSPKNSIGEMYWNAHTVDTAQQARVQRTRASDAQRRMAKILAFIGSVEHLGASKSTPYLDLLGPLQLLPLLFRNRRATFGTDA